MIVTASSEVHKPELESDAVVCCVVVCVHCLVAHCSSFGCAESGGAQDGRDARFDETHVA